MGLSKSNLQTPIFILFLTVISFGLIIPVLGFYQDDWYQLWFGRSFGAKIYLDFFAGERPFIAWMYMLITSLIGYTPLGWQLFGLAARFLAALSVWKLIRITWPNQSRVANIATILFVIYPGFRQQYLPVIYGQYFIQFTVQILSIIWMILAIIRPRRYWGYTIAGLLSGAFGLFTSEYFFGIELLRPLFLLIILKQNNHLHWRGVFRIWIKHWCLYLGLVIIFIIWRVYIYEFPTYQPFFVDVPTQDLFPLIFKKIAGSLVDSINVGFIAWIEIWKTLDNFYTSTPMLIYKLFVAIVGSVGVLLFLMKFSPKDENRGEKGIYRIVYQIIALGVIGLLTAGIPFWVVGLPINTGFYSGSRFLISFMLAASLLMTGILVALPWSRLTNIFLTLIVGMALLRHGEDELTYRKVHILQASFFQQILWRIPDLEPGTLLLTSPFHEGELSGDNSLTAAMNWIYDVEPPYELEYLVFHLPDRIQEKSIPSLKPDIKFTRQFRGKEFQASTNQVVVAYYFPPACVRVLDPEIDLIVPKPLEMPKQLMDAVQLANTNMIITHPEHEIVLPHNLFRYRPPENSWCHDYEKADLARQMKDWTAIVRIADSLHLDASQAHNTWELIPFIEGYAMADNWGAARRLTFEALKNPMEREEVSVRIICGTWRHIADTSSNDEAFKRKANELIREINCE